MKHRLFNIILAILILMGMIAIPAIVQGWNCTQYTFNVSAGGVVSVRNNSGSNEPAQGAKLYINGVYQSPDLVVPARPAHSASFTLRNIVPPTTSWTWVVDGNADCYNSGSYTIQPTNTPTKTNTPTSTNTPTNTPTGTQPPTGTAPPSGTAPPTGTEVSPSETPQGEPTYVGAQFCLAVIPLGTLPTDVTYDYRNVRWLDGHDFEHNAVYVVEKQGSLEVSVWLYENTYRSGDIVIDNLVTISYDPARIPVCYQTDLPQGGGESFFNCTPLVRGRDPACEVPSDLDTTLITSEDAQIVPERVGWTINGVMFVVPRDCILVIPPSGYGGDVVVRLPDGQTFLMEAFDGWYEADPNRCLFDGDNLVVHAVAGSTPQQLAMSAQVSDYAEAVRRWEAVYGAGVVHNSNTYVGELWAGLFTHQ